MLEGRGSYLVPASGQNPLSLEDHCSQFNPVGGFPSSFYGCMEYACRQCHGYALILREDGFCCILFSFTIDLSWKQQKCLRMASRGLNRRSYANGCTVSIQAYRIDADYRVLGRGCHGKGSLHCSACSKHMS